MIYAFEHPDSLQLVSYTDFGIHELFWDKLGVELFNFADCDLSGFLSAFVAYYNSRIDEKTFECLEPENDLLPQLYQSLSEMHPFFLSADHTSSLPYLLANTLSEHAAKENVSEEKYKELLHHLTSPALADCVSLSNVLSPYYDELLFEMRFCDEYHRREKASVQQEWKRGGVNGLQSLQTFTSTYVSWILYSSSTLFSDLSLNGRMKVFSKVFGDVNFWQPFTTTVTSCGPEPTANDIQTILRRGQYHLLEHLDDLDSAVKDVQKQVATEMERQHHASVLFGLDIDNTTPPSGTAEWLNSIIDAAKEIPEQPLYDAFVIKSFPDYVLLQLKRITEARPYVKRCKNCGRYFMTERPNVDYCQRISPGDTRPCIEIGPTRVFNRNRAEDKARSLYAKAYKRVQARLRRKTITENEFSSWRDQAKEYLEKVQNGDISLEEYTEWMEQ